MVLDVWPGGAILCLIYAQMHNLHKLGSLMACGKQLRQFIKAIMARDFPRNATEMRYGMQGQRPAIALRMVCHL